MDALDARTCGGLNELSILFSVYLGTIQAQEQASIISHGGMYLWQQVKTLQGVLVGDHIAPRWGKLE